MTDAEVQERLTDYFDPAKSIFSPFNMDEIIDQLGFSLEPEELIGLSGAPKGSTVTAEVVGVGTTPPGFDDPPSKIEDTPKGIKLTVKNSIFIEDFNEVIIYRTSSNTTGLYIQLVDFTDAFGFTGVGALMIKSLLGVIAATELAFDRLRLMAAGGRSWGDRNPQGKRWIGYNVWPKMGFDMPLHAETGKIVPFFGKFPSKLRACARVSDVLALKPGGKEFWSLVGDGWYMEFELSDPKALEKLNIRLAEARNGTEA
jgi:hypothetical protein